MLKLIQVDKTYSNLQQIKTLYKNSFPREERDNIAHLIHHHKDKINDIDLLAFEDENQFIGFVFMLSHGRFSHILYFAIAPELRSHGYGSKVLEMVFEYRKGQTFLVDVEPIEDKCINISEREKRISFYQRIGFKSTGLYYSWNGVDYQILSIFGDVSVNEFRLFWKYFRFEEDMGTYLIRTFSLSKYTDNLLKEKLKSTDIYKRISETKELYDELNQKEEDFCNTFNIHCGEGCGKCCTRFIPDITEEEAIYLAFGLISEGKDQKILDKLDSLKDDIKGCPLYRSNNGHHCSVYNHRPLICRLFGAAATERKDGHPFFMKCKWNKNGISVDSKTLEEHIDKVVVMDKYGLLMDELNPGNDTTEMLPIALKKAIYKIRLLVQLCEESEN